MTPLTTLVVGGRIIIGLRVSLYIGGLLALCLTPALVHAEDAASDLSGNLEGSVMQIAAADASVYTASDFERFAPRNALDMLSQVPGFSIRSEDGQRGLGQATANVLINGERISSKSDGVFSQLRRISLDRVVQIEIVDGADLGIPGLSGQAANVVTRPAAISGQFEYRATARPKYARPSFFGGEISLSGSDDELEWTVAYNHGVGRGGAGGGESFVLDNAGNVIEDRDVVIRFVGDFPRLSGQVSWTSPGGTELNFNANYGRNYTNFSDDEARDLVVGTDFLRNFDNRGRGYNYELGGDIDFALGPGRLKLVGLERFNQNRSRQNAIATFADGSADEGNRFSSVSDSGERIARAEYSWDMLGGSWQLDAEAAFNRLDRTASLFELDPTGEFVEIDFSNGTGGVTEDRYEMILSHNRSLSDDLTLQIGAGGEYSTLTQTGPGGLTRSFWRPKGSVSLAWSAADDLDISLKLNRTVGQLSFGDFLASVSLSQNNQNAGNVQLVPPQSWELDIEIEKEFGDWANSTLRLEGRWIEDYIEFIPLPGGLEARGNIPSAQRFNINWISTIELSEIGFNGAKLDTTMVYRYSRLRDPLTGEKRHIGGSADISIFAELRHDIPGSDWAWGVGLDYNRPLPFFRLREVTIDSEGPAYSYAYIEHKDVLGLTVNLQVFNLTDGRAFLERTVYDGFRNEAPVLFEEHRDLSVQPIFRIQLSGDF